MLRKGSLPHIAEGSYPQESPAPRDVFQNREVLTFPKSTLSLHGVVVSLSIGSQMGYQGHPHGWVLHTAARLHGHMMLCA